MDIEEEDTGKTAKKQNIEGEGQLVHTIGDIRGNFNSKWTF